MRGTDIFAALRYRDYRLLWIGLLVSNLGTWMQFTAQGYLVSQIAGSPHRAALFLGFLGAARAVPVLLLSPVAGVVAARVGRRSGRARPVPAAGGERERGEHQGAGNRAHLD